MAYCTSSDIQNAVGGSAALIWITDLTNTAIDTSAVTSAIEYATGEVDTYVTGLPGTTGVAGAMWSTTPTQAKQCSINIAVEVLYERIRREVPERIAEASKRSYEQLKMLQKGTVSWDVSQTPSSQNVGTVWQFNPESTARSTNPRRTLRSTLDKF